MMYQGQGKVHKTISYAVTNFVPRKLKQSENKYFARGGL